jgi:SAM-dependent methyltransferase
MGSNLRSRQLLAARHHDTHADANSYEPGLDEHPTMTSANDLERTSKRWGEAQSQWDFDKGDYWGGLPAVRQRLDAKICGYAGVDWINYTLQRYFVGRLPLGHCLSLGCGTGMLERELARRGAFEHCTASDVAEASISQARLNARREGYLNIEYLVRDDNTAILPSTTYDAVWAHDSVHHLVSFDHVFSQVAQSLKSEGLFILSEYVGPDRFQFPKRQREIIEACLKLIPDRHRRRLITPPVLVGQPTDSSKSSTTTSAGNIARLVRRLVEKTLDGELPGTARRKWHSWRARRRGEVPMKIDADLPGRHSVIAWDPSEAARSSQLLPSLRRHFEIIEVKPLGGTILQFLLAGIAGNFSSDDGERVLRMLFNIEDTLMEVGDLESDFLFIVAKPKSHFVAS